MKRKRKIITLPIHIDSVILFVRGERVILDMDLAKIYGIPTFRLNEAIKRNKDRFPGDFLFQLTQDEHDALTSQIAISKKGSKVFTFFCDFLMKSLQTTTGGLLDILSQVMQQKGCLRSSRSIF